MKNYNLNIAGYNIRFEAEANGLELVPSERFLRNICDNNGSDVLIRIHSGIFNIPVEAERVFHAPYVEEINGIQIHNRTNFWSVWKHNSDLYIRTIFPLSSSENNAILKFSLTSRDWDLWFDGAENEIDPFEYPLDGLILYYLTVIYGDIMIHASGINNAGRGYIFSGVSGKGKSTMARLWDDSGAKVIHDDRLILRSKENGYRMYNTPVYNNDEPHESILNKIFIIEHGIANKLVPVKGATAVSLVMANCIQHNWGSDIIAGLLGSVSIMCARIPTVKLFFKPDRSIIDHILENE
ncbi:MAG: hypothetical protein EPN88_13385 [Bacteroidetes bacterium]|nr:MAG: hypothetical protein EPN88_13385 [Bacteroidota bacterium]